MIIANSFASAQKKTPSNFNAHHKNIYLEGLGSHLLAGVNFDMRLHKGRMDGIGFRAGIGGVSVSGNSQNTAITISGLAP